MTAESTETIHSRRAGHHVTIEDHGEHHMGCRTLVFAPSVEIEGVSRFQTTNGAAFFTPDGDGLILHDACVIVFVDLETREAFHRESPTDETFSNVRLRDEGPLAWDLVARDGSRKPGAPVALEDLRSDFVRGLGRVASGRFPSAHGTVV
jgi:hypothetical protein